MQFQRIFCLLSLQEALLNRIKDENFCNQILPAIQAKMDYIEHFNEHNKATPKEEEMNKILIDDGIKLQYVSQEQMKRYHHEN